MKNEDVVKRLEEVQANAAIELALLIADMQDAGFEDYDIEAIEYAKKDIATALLRIADQFPIKRVVQKM